MNSTNVVNPTSNATFLLKGAVRKSGTRVRITVQLLRASDGSYVWTETFDRISDDDLAVEYDVAKIITKELNTKILGECLVSDRHSELNRGTNGTIRETF
jgi:TolB-like protein